MAIPSIREIRPQLNFGPRAGIAWSLDSKTVVRGGYGLFWAPPQIAQAFDQGALGTRGFTATTTYTASTDGGLSPCSGCSLTNPFPNGIASPQGAAEGLLTGVGGDIDFIDQSSRTGYVHQYSIDVKRELTARMSVSVGYLGSRSERLSLGGTIDTRLNINQLDPRYFSLGSALQELVPNPFFGIAEFGARARSSTIARGELLRPYPQFTNVFAHRVNAARSRYNALSVGLERRHSAGWSGRVNYVFSVRKDNQVGRRQRLLDQRRRAPSTATTSTGSSATRCSTRRIASTSAAASSCHSGPASAGWPTAAGSARWSVDGRSAAWAGTRAGSRLPWFNPTTTSTCSAACSGPTSSPASTRASPAIRQDNYDPTCSCIPYLNPDAWSAAPPFTFGDAPHSDARVRTPFRKNWDIAVHKTHPIGGTRLTVRAELINAFDTPSFAGPRPPFGTPVVFGSIAAVNGFPRTLQLQARVEW